MGTYEELLATSTSFAQLLEDIHQHEQELISNALTTQQSAIGSISSEKDSDDEKETLPTNLETKQQGTVRWHVYVAYLRAGVGLVLGVALILILFSAQQIVSISSDRWLADWSADNTRRYRNVTNCNNKLDQKVVRIQLMSDREWKIHRDQRFYIFAGEQVNVAPVISLISCVAALVLILFCLASVRVVVTRLICLNAGRVLHNK